MYTNRVYRVLHRGLPRTGKFAAALAVVALVGAFGAGIGVAGNPSRSCPVQPATSQPFLQWGDTNSYFLAPAGDMESSPFAAGWSLSGGASLVAGSEPSDVSANSSDSFSLGLPGGSSATTPQICVTIQDPQFRTFVRNTGDPKAQLMVQALIITSSGQPKTYDLGSVKGSSDWTLSSPVLFKSAIQPGADGTGQIAFTFTPKDATGNWQIDDLYIDPIKSQGSDSFGGGWGGGWGCC
jgi:hypothetical protein